MWRSTTRPGHRRSARLIVAVLLATSSTCLAVYIIQDHIRSGGIEKSLESQRRYHEQHPRGIVSGRISLYWDQPLQSRSSFSNIHPSDYVGPEACKKCHAENYDDWSNHPHRWMNALADQTTVKGDFSGNATIDYLGGQARFYQHRGEYRMSLTRDQTRQVYVIHQTIGSRFFQYYVGTRISGPKTSGKAFHQVDQVLPFGYWLDEGAWIPVVHIGVERPDGERVDPFVVSQAGREGHASGFSDFSYAQKCNPCHTTFPLGDSLLRKTKMLAQSVPVSLHFSMPRYLAEAHPNLWNAERKATELNNEGVEQLIKTMAALEAPQHAVTLGVSCEACHLGCKQHLRSELSRPKFLPYSPYLLTNSMGREISDGASHENVNWVCSRCHAGPRPQFAEGMATWNSTEFSDADQGSCYSQLTCIHCHDPHRAIGPAWPFSGKQDDARCLDCHKELQSDEARRAHTHHRLQSDGSRCMNCHMPRINEGLQDIVRTHAIFSPTSHVMLEENHPNACNICHVDRPIDWTLKFLDEWYGARYSEAKIARNYPLRDQPVTLNWLASDNESVRLIGADALIRAKAEWSLSQLIEMLDDPYLINRQFVGRGLGRMLGIRLTDVGYQFYMTPAERREPLRRLRTRLLGPARK